MIELMRQIKNNPKVDLGEDDTKTFKKAESRFSSCWGEDGKPMVSRATA
jgi:hypothetical protein